MDIGEEIHSREESRMDEEEKDRYLEDRRDMEEMIDRSMVDIVILLGGDQTPEEDRIPEAEKDSGEIDRGHQTEFKISRDMFDVNVIPVSRLERLWLRSWWSFR